MKAKDTRLYTSAASYNNGPEFMRNEVDMWHAGGSLLLQAVVRAQKAGGFGGLQSEVGRGYREQISPVSILDVCCGPGNFPNHLSLYVPNIRVTGIDLNEGFLDYARKAYGSLGWQFIRMDASDFYLGKKFDFVTASSAYHHISDEKKCMFLEKIVSHLAEEGRVIVCENFLPSYNDNSRIDAVHRYYSALIEFYEHGNATPEAIRLIKEVYALELSGEEEHKVDYQRFLEHVKKAGLEVEADRVIWQPPEFHEDNAGSHVLVLKRRIL